jgi:hypothetical protein
MTEELADKLKVATTATAKALGSKRTMRDAFDDEQLERELTKDRRVEE